MWLKIYLTSIIKSGPVLNSRSLLKLNYLHLASLLSIPTRLLTNERRKDYILDPFFCLDDRLTNIQVPNRHVSLDWNSLSSARTRLVFVVSFVVASNFAAHKYLIFTHFLKRGTVMKDKKLQLGYAILYILFPSTNKLWYKKFVFERRTVTKDRKLGYLTQHILFISTIIYIDNDEEKLC